MLAQCAHEGAEVPQSQQMSQQPVADPIAAEADSVAALAALAHAMRPLGAEQLLYAHVSLARLAGTTYTPGAMLPDAAQRLTRPARQSEWQRRVTLRADTQRRASLRRALGAAA